MLCLLTVDRVDLSLISGTHRHPIIITIFENLSIEAKSCHFFLVDKSRASEFEWLENANRSLLEQGQALKGK